MNVFHSLMLYLRLPKQLFNRWECQQVVAEARLTFVVKSIDSIRTCCFVITTEKEEILRISSEKRLIGKHSIVTAQNGGENLLDFVR